MRTKLDPEITQALLRCQYMDDTVFTLDANKMSLRWLSDGHKRCNEPRAWGRALTSRPEPTSTEEASDQGT